MSFPSPHPLPLLEARRQKWWRAQTPAAPQPCPAAFTVPSCCSWSRNGVNGFHETSSWALRQAEADRVRPEGSLLLLALVLHHQQELLVPWTPSTQQLGLLRIQHTTGFPLRVVQVGQLGTGDLAWIKSKPI